MTLYDAHVPDDPSSTVEESTLKARHGFWIQTLRNDPPSSTAAVYFSTFQEGRGQHLTALDVSQARTLAGRLVTLADEVDGRATFRTKNADV